MKTSQIGLLVWIAFVAATISIVSKKDLFLDEIVSCVHSGDYFTAILIGIVFMIIPVMAVVFTIKMWIKQ